MRMLPSHVLESAEVSITDPIVIPHSLIVTASLTEEIISSTVAEEWTGSLARGRRVDMPVAVSYTHLTLPTKA